MLLVSPGKPHVPSVLLGTVPVERIGHKLACPLAVVVLPGHLLCLPRSGREALRLFCLSLNVSELPYAG